MAVADPPPIAGTERKGPTAMTYSTDPHTDPQLDSAPHRQQNPYGSQTPYVGPNAYGYTYPGQPYGYGAHHPMPAKTSQNKTWLWITAIVAVLVIGGGVVMIAPFAFLAYQTSQITSEIGDISGGSTEQILSDELDVELGDIEIDSDSYSESGEMTVKLTNKSDKRATFNVSIEAAAESGERIADGTAYASDLAPGQSVTTDVTFYPNGDATQADLADATYNVISVSRY